MYIRSSTDHAGTVAAIDIGSNSIHLVVAKMDQQGHLNVLDSDKFGVRLGAYLTPDGMLSREGQLKAISTISHMAEIARAYKATVRAVATHALREAKNHGEIIEEVAEKTGVRIEIIDGVEEARLVYLGMRYALPLERQLCLGMDIGGGSTEFILAHGDDIRFATSIKIGAVTLTKQQFRSVVPNQTQIKRLHEYINLRIEPLVGQIQKHVFKKAVASSGTAKAIAGVHSKLFRDRSLSDENGYVVPVKDLETIVRAMEELKSPKRIKEAFGVDTARADILLAGAAIMREASRAFNIAEWTITTYGLREGVVIDSFRRMGSERLGKVKDIRWGSVVDFGARWQIDELFAAQVTATALDIFDKLAPILYPIRSKDAWIGDRDILRVAAWLHEIGKFLSTSSYHKHSYYLLEHGRLAGFTQDEKHLISLVALHHRKSAPKFDSGELKSLRHEDFERVVFLSGILRMASALNRSRRGIVGSVAVSKSRNLQFKFRVQRGSDPIVEFQQLEREREVLEKAFGWHLMIDENSRTMVGRKVKTKLVKKRKLLAKISSREYLARSRGAKKATSRVLKTVKKK